MATTTKNLNFCNDENGLAVFGMLGGGNLLRGMAEAWKLAKGFAPLTNFWYFPFSHATINGTNSFTIHFYEPCLLAALEFNSTDLDTTSISFKVNSRDLQFTGSGSALATGISTKYWDAISNMPILIALDKDDDLTISVTDTGVQTITGILAAFLLPPRQST